MEVTWSCCSGRVERAALGMVRHASKQQQKAILSCCSGHGNRGMLGMQRKYVGVQLTVDIWRLCSGLRSWRALEKAQTLLSSKGEPILCGV
jgi:hypothetical protein